MRDDPRIVKKNCTDAHKHKKVICPKPPRLKMYSEGRRGSSGSRRRSVQSRLRQLQFPYQMGINMAQSEQNLNALAQSGGSGLFNVPVLTPAQQMQQTFQQRQQQNILQQQQSMLMGGQFGFPMSASSMRRGRRTVDRPTMQIPTLVAQVLGGGGASGGVTTALGGEASTHKLDADDNPWQGLYLLIEYLKTEPAKALWKDFKIEPKEIVDLSIDIRETMAAEVNKNKIFGFIDDPNKDSTAIYLSPAMGIPIHINEPVPAIYPTIIHYVETMKIASLSQPPLMGAVAATACNEARTVLSILASQPSSQSIHVVADTCLNRETNETDWFKPEAARGRFIVYCWLGIWAKYTQNQRMAQILMATGDTLLMYDNANPDYGIGDVERDKGGIKKGHTYPGMNVIGFLLMFMRVLLKHKLHQTNNPIGFFTKLVLPAVTAVYRMAKNIPHKLELIV